MEERDFKHMSIGERIAVVRKEANLSQMELAELAGVGHSTISKWELGISEPRTTGVDKIAHALDIKLSWLMYGTGDKTVAETAKRTEEKRKETSVVYKISTENDLKNIVLIIKNLKSLSVSKEEKRAIYRTLSKIRVELEEKTIFGEE